MKPEFYMVIAWDDYYPCPNNIRGVFEKLEDAEVYMEEIKKMGYDELGNYDNYRIIYSEELPWGGE